jgi:LDH2 family malate/lactate/ureidoglycolate dehydrogenase
MFGVRTHGISRIPQYLSRVKIGGINVRAEPARPAGRAALLAELLRKNCSEGPFSLA